MKKLVTFCAIGLAILTLPVFNSPVLADWCDDFESYPVGSNASPNWSGSGNTPGMYIDNSKSVSGSNSLKLFGIIGGCWGVIAYHSLQMTYPFTIELNVLNGTEALSGCHPYHASMEFKMGTNWWDQTIPGGFAFTESGDFWPRVDGPEAPISGFALNQWHTVRGEYTTPGDGLLHVEYWVNDQYIGEFTTAEPSVDPPYIGIAAQEGTVWFDDVCVNSGELCEPEQLDVLWTAPEEAEMNTPYEITLGVTNPLSESQCYRFSLKENALQSDPPNDQATWFLDDEEWSNSQTSQATLEGLNSNTHVYEIKHDWDWIPPWSPLNLVTDVLAPFLMDIVSYPAPGGTMLLIMLAVQSEIGAVRTADFQYMGLVHDAPDTFEVCIVVPPWKQTALVASHATSIAGAVATFIGYRPPVIIPNLLIVEAFSIILSQGFYIIAADPPDMNFEIIVQPEFPNIAQIDSLPPSEERKFAASALHLYSITSAIMSSMEKYQGATLQESSQWQLTHLEAAKAYSAEASEISQLLAVMFQNAVAGLEPPSSDELQAIRDSILANGLPEIEVQILTELGFSQSEIDDIALAVASMSDEYFSDLNFGPAAFIITATAFSEFASSLPPVPSGTISAKTEIEPDDLTSLCDHGYVSCKMEFDGPFGITEIDLNSVMLNNTIYADPAWLEFKSDEDGADIEVRFNCEDVFSLLGDDPGQRVLVVNGHVIAQSETVMFAGADVITIEGEDENGYGKLANLIPRTFYIQQNYPNPFNAITTIKYGIPEASYVTVQIYDLLGRAVATLVNENQQPGLYEVTWDAGNQSSGIYFYKIQAGDYSETRKMVLMK